MLLEIYHHDALPPDNIVGESNQGFSNVWGLLHEGGGDVGGGAGVEGGGAGTNPFTFRSQSGKYNQIKGFGHVY